MTLYDPASAVRKPEGGHYSPGYFSRLERGWASAPLYTYLAVADALEVDAGVLLGPDAASLATSEAEAMLLRCLRSLGIPPHDAMAALVVARGRNRGDESDARHADPQLATLDQSGFGPGDAPFVDE